MSPLNEDEQRCLLNVARQAIAAALRKEGLDVGTLAVPLPSTRLSEVGAAFVSLHRQSRLRGCVGYIVARKPLYETVAEAATAAAFHDLRFPPLKEDELEALVEYLYSLRPQVAAGDAWE